MALNPQPQWKFRTNPRTNDLLEACCALRVVCYFTAAVSCMWRWGGVIAESSFTSTSLHYRLQCLSSSLRGPKFWCENHDISQLSLSIGMPLLTSVHTVDRVPIQPTNMISKQSLDNWRYKYSQILLKWCWFKLCGPEAPSRIQPTWLIIVICASRKDFSRPINIWVGGTMSHVMLGWPQQCPM